MSRNYNKLIELSRNSALDRVSILNQTGSESMSHEQVCRDIESINVIRNLSDAMYNVLLGWQKEG